MSQINGNNAHFEMNGVVLNTHFAGEVSNEMTADTEDITSGSGATHIARAGKLIDTKTDFYLIMDDTYFNEIRPLLQAGSKVHLVYGPDTNASGKPKFEGKVIITSVGMAQSIEKNKVGFDISTEQAEKPISTLTGDLAGVFP